MKKEIRNEKISIQLQGNKRRLGKIHSNDSKLKIAEHNKGYHWFNNEQIELKAKECPIGFSKGRLKKEGHWYTNFEQNVWATEKPEGKRWIKGRYSYNEGKHWVNDGEKNFLLEKISATEYKELKYRYGIIRKPRTLKPKKIEKKVYEYQPPKLKHWVPDNTPVEPLKFEKLEVSVIERTCAKLEREEREQIRKQNELISKSSESFIGEKKSVLTAEEFLKLLENRTPSEESLALLAKHGI